MNSQVSRADCWAAGYDTSGIYWDRAQEKNLGVHWDPDYEIVRAAVGEQVGAGVEYLPGSDLNWREAPTDWSANAHSCLMRRRKPKEWHEL